MSPITWWWAGTLHFDNALTLGNLTIRETDHGVLMSGNPAGNIALVDTATGNVTVFTPFGLEQQLGMHGDATFWGNVTLHGGVAFLNPIVTMAGSLHVDGNLLCNTALVQGNCYVRDCVVIVDMPWWTAT